MTLTMVDYKRLLQFVARSRPRVSLRAAVECAIQKFLAGARRSSKAGR